MTSVKNTLLIGLIATIIYVGYAYWQPVYTYSLLDSRYDAHKYLHAYQFFAHQSPNLTLSYPFNLRLGVPYLASLLPFSTAETNFIWLNGICIVLTVMLLAQLWQKLQIPLWAIAVGLFWILFHWKGLVRMYLPDPITADVVGYLLQTLWLYFFISPPAFLQKNLMRMVAFGAVISAVGVSQKESFLAVVGVTFLVYFIENLRKDTPPAPPYKGGEFSTVSVSSKRSLMLIALISLIVALITYLSINYFNPAVPSDWRNNGAISVLRGVKRYISQPELFVRLPVSWLMAYGFIWVEILTQPNTSKKNVLPPCSPSKKGGVNSSSSNSYSLNLLCYLSLLWLLLSMVGGGDTTRIFFNGMPFVLTFLLLQFRYLSVWQGIYMLIASLPLMRLHELEPDLGKYPQEAHRWCVECWTWTESWSYWLYALVVLTGYYYFVRYLGRRRDAPQNIDTRS